MIVDIPTKNCVVYYHIVREGKFPIIVEINLDNNLKEKYTSKSENTFNNYINCLLPKKKKSKSRNIYTFLNYFNT
jgi:hypothetical protein